MAFAVIVSSSPVPVFPVSVNNGWQFFANGAVVPVDTPEVSYVRNLHLAALSQAQNGAQQGFTHSGEASVFNLPQVSAVSQPPLRIA